MIPTLNDLEAEGWIATLDVEIASTLARLGSETDPLVVLAVALVSRQVRHGHVCLDIERLVAGDLPIDAPDGAAPLALPAAGTWRKKLAKSRLVSTGAARATPLALDSNGRLYFQRYFDHQETLADLLTERIERPSREVSDEIVRNVFAGMADEGQRSAVARALGRDLVVVTGGPGTGKTTTVARILAALAEHHRREGRQAPRVSLLAPTGKAAARLGESIVRARATIPCSDEVRAAIPSAAQTIHRALGIGVAGVTRPRRTTEDPLQADVVVVDEASMVDLPMMRRLFDALPREARVVLLGDESQLASVEVGSVLADLGQVDGPFDASGSVARLTTTHRYAEAGSIDTLADAIRRGDADSAIATLSDEQLPDVRFVEATSEQGALAALRPIVVSAFAPLLAADGEAAIELLDRFRVLAPHRTGKLGVDALNRVIEAWLLDDRERLPVRPVLITRNDYALELWNGDVGAIVEGNERSTASFPGPKGPRRIPVERLPPHESVFAMSVHKSQGSEVSEVVVVLPTEPFRSVTRELLYTAVTRARRAVTVVGSRATLVRAIERRVERASGLRDALLVRARHRDRQGSLPF